MSNSRTFFIHVNENNEFSLDNIIAASGTGTSRTTATNQLLAISENQIIGWEQLNEIAIGTAKGIAYLHEECAQRIIHYSINFEILLFEIIGRRRHHDDSLNQSQKWLPRWVWEKFEKRELDEMMGLYDIEEKNREKAERMPMVALWCVQYLPEA
ncbi:hypothetical protein GIB67_013626 [Kingdonia uniflora]|uniref:Uncharacterized protein n=1 Tax=Kingdonia uniflora TaxID=39325 RepID=A0A7J7NPU5_9MAGN|nr:hypothetical protein GIB67_013626 [Kingdonia uniflora]